MKALTKTLKSQALVLWNDESAQGATEYILLVVVIVGLILVFQNKIKEAITGKMSDLTSAMGNVQAQ